MKKLSSVLEDVKTSIFLVSCWVFVCCFLLFTNDTANASPQSDTTNCPHLDELQLLTEHVGDINKHGWLDIGLFLQDKASQLTATCTASPEDEIRLHQLQHRTSLLLENMLYTHSFIAIDIPMIAGGLLDKEEDSGMFSHPYERILINESYEEMLLQLDESPKGPNLAETFIDALIPYMEDNVPIPRPLIHRQLRAGLKFLEDSEQRRMQISNRASYF